MTQIGHFSWNLGLPQNSMKNEIFERIRENIREATTLHWGVNHQSMKISDLGLHAILKLIHQQNCNVLIIFEGRRYLSIYHMISVITYL